MRAFFILVSLCLPVEQRSCAPQSESTRSRDPRPRKQPRTAPARPSIVRDKIRPLEALIGRFECLALIIQQ